MADSIVPMHSTHPSSQAGQTLIEVLVTALVVLLISAATATALVSSNHASGDQRQHAEADTLASQDQERMRGLSDEQLANLGGTGQSHTTTVDGVTFTIASTTASTSAGGQSSCTAGSASDFQATSTVSWREQSASESVSADSLIARPTVGDLVVTATDETGAPLSGVSVAATSTATTTDPPTYTGVTDANGCLMLAGLPASGYTLQYSKTGYVDPTGSATPGATVSVTTSGTPTKNTVALGLASGITATLTGLTSTGTASGDADALSYTSIGNATPITATAASASSTFALSSLYPWDATPTTTPSYTNNYTLWAGKCVQQEPPAAKQTTATVEPGVPANPYVTEPELDIQTVNSSGAATAPLSIKLTFKSSSGTSCTDTWYPPLAAAVSTTTGWLKDPGQPYAPTGTLTVCASYKSGSSTYYGTALTGNTSFVSPTAVTVKMSSGTSC